ncbi:MAG: sulfite exporter TauE/SafE family protein [Candidatus Eisenbacteria bacterium]|uniref:Probable membrane transporter protein n=1 Tax=Eiseniibacteriota bacterium TaxID=2212470 RepID=A0A9D6QJ89_UNCEI|nr:sulfite exporter TauE/SafE family protein [Candidatus Eisenbacteria bacterium]MBI3538970.1 sulfite exporter TauE/SafE family protein [Candidatus Eisenbacteria bacterium]
MTARDRARGLFVGAVAGLAGGLFGVGGGLVLVPMLTGGFGLTQHRAHGTSLAVIGATAIAALFVYGAHANVQWATAAAVAVGSIVGAPLGARWAGATSAAGLRRAFAAFLVLVAFRLLWDAPVVRGAAALAGPGALAFDVAVGIASGTLAGFMGVGGGILMVPAFTLAFGMTQQQAQGTSLAVILVTGPVAALAHSRRGNVAWGLAPALAIGAALGAPAAAWAAQVLPRAWLGRAFALFLLASAVHMWTRKPRAAPPGPTASES